MEVGSHRLQAVPDNLFSTFAAVWCEITAVAVFTVKLTFLLNKSNFLEGPLTLVHGAKEAARAPSLPHCGDEGTSDR